MSIDRERRLEILRDEKEALWPLIDHQSCRLCAQPRQPEWAKGYAICFHCKQHRDLYGQALDDLIPITYSAKTWALGSAIRRFKDLDNADPNQDRAASLGAILSAFLERQLPRLFIAMPTRVQVVPVPSSKPVVVNVLRRAESEGWWVPPTLVTDLVRARDDVPRQRERSGTERRIVENKWEVDRHALDELHPVLLLDDMYTTGGSIHSLALALRQAGARSVTALVIERSVGTDDGEWIDPLLRAAVESGHIWTPDENKLDVIR